MTNILYLTKSIIKSFFNISECQKQLIQYEKCLKNGKL